MNDIARDLYELEIRQRKDDLLVGVLAGGISSEREISLKTGRNVLDSLQRSGYSVTFIDPLDEGFIEKIKKVDIAFLALHGIYGEDGTVQGLLELLKLPYTGSGVLSSALALDKILSKKLMIKEGVPTPDCLEIIAKDPSKKIMNLDREIMERMGYPVVVKPNTEGSSIGISLVNNILELKKGISEASTYDYRVMIEKYIKGREFTVGVIGKNPRALPIIEIKPNCGFFDYDSKYVKNLTEYIVPAEIEENLSRKILDLSLDCHLGFGCCGISRVDFILDDNNTPYVLEINTMPGMTSTSLVPMASKSVGIGFDHLVEIILDSSDLKIR